MLFAKSNFARPTEEDTGPVVGDERGLAFLSMALQLHLSGGHPVAARLSS